MSLLLAFSEEGRCDVVSYDFLPCLPLRGTSGSRSTVINDTHHVSSPDICSNSHRVCDVVDNLTYNWSTRVKETIVV